MNMKRVYAGIIDYFIVCIIQTVLMFWFLLLPIIGSNNASDFNILARAFIISYCSMVYLIIRDIIGNKSIGKRILKLKIINKNDGRNANFKSRLIRNLTWILGGLDIVVFLISKERVGDKIAKTDVAEL